MVDIFRADDDNFGMDSSAPFRYDPNDLSMDDDSGTAESAIKNLNFSTIKSGSSASSSSCSRDNGGLSATSTTTRSGVSPDWMGEDGEESYTASSGAAQSFPVKLVAIMSCGVLSIGKVKSRDVESR